MRKGQSHYTLYTLTVWLVLSYWFASNKYSDFRYSGLQNHRPLFACIYDPQLYSRFHIDRKKRRGRT